MPKLLTLTSILLGLSSGGLAARQAVAACIAPGSCVSTRGSCSITSAPGGRGCEINTKVANGSPGGSRIDVDIKTTSGVVFREFSFTAVNEPVEIDCSGCGGQAICIDADGCENGGGNVFSCNYLVSCTGSGSTETCTWSQVNWDCDEF